MTMHVTHDTSTTGSAPRGRGRANDVPPGDDHSA